MIAPEWNRSALKAVAFVQERGQQARAGGGGRSAGDRRAVIEHPYWWDTVADAPIEAPAPLPARADVVVVGGGYTGLSAARELARRGASVLVLERERIGWGASSRNGGQVLTGLKLDAATLVARHGEWRARELFERSLESIDVLERLIAGRRDRVRLRADGASAGGGEAGALSRLPGGAGPARPRRSTTRSSSCRPPISDPRSAPASITA